MLYLECECTENVSIVVENQLLIYKYINVTQKKRIYSLLIRSLIVGNRNTKLIRFQK